MQQKRKVPFKINQQAAPIDKTELKLLEDRRKPTSIAARAIIRSGKGHKYWSSFSKENQEIIQQLATEINQILFEPRLQNPIKTLDLPIAGKLYSAATLPLVVDMISIVSQNSSNPQSKSNDDDTGLLTIEVLKQVRKIVFALNSNHASSLGLHPVVYFYSQEGRYKSSSFLAMVDFVAKILKTAQLDDFIEVRSQFERFVVDYDYLAQQINRKHRTAQRSYPHISKFFMLLMNDLKDSKADADIIKSLQSNKDFSYIAEQHIYLPDGQVGAKFNGDDKSAIYLREVLKSAPKCKICGGYMHRNAISIDHIEPRARGGSSSKRNGQLTHPYCNTGYKTKKQTNKKTPSPT